MKAALALTLALAPALTAATHAAPQRAADEGRPLRVEVRVVDDDYVCTLAVDNAPLDRVLGKIAVQIGYGVEGLDAASRPTLVTADLALRPLGHVLEVVLGSVGLGYELGSKTIRVLPEPAEGLSADGIAELASAAYERALAANADHRLAPAARLGQGELAEMRGLPSAALEHYRALAESYPRAPEVHEARMRAGLVLESLYRWSEAAEQYRELANSETAHGYEAASRLGLARCTVEMGDAQNALFLLAALDQAHAVGPGPERDARELVRARCLVGLDRHLEALQILEVLEQSLKREDQVEALRIRALALQGAGNPGDAGRAWLLYAEAVEEPRRADGLEQAVRLALAAGDELGALFLCRRASEHGHALRFNAYRDEAYERLGLKPATAVAARTAAERIESAEARLAAEQPWAAVEEVADLIAGSAALEPKLQVRLAAVWSSTIAADRGIEPALEYLRSVRGRFEGAEVSQQRAEIDVLAAELLESRSLFDRAVDAYRGVY